MKVQSQFIEMFKDKGYPLEMIKSFADVSTGSTPSKAHPAQPTNPVECVHSLTQKHVAKRYMIGEKFLPLRHES